MNRLRSLMEFECPHCMQKGPPRVNRLHAQRSKSKDMCFVLGCANASCGAETWVYVHQLAETGPPHPQDMVAWTHLRDALLGTYDLPKDIVEHYAWRTLWPLSHRACAGMETCFPKVYELFMATVQVSGNSVVSGLVLAYQALERFVDTLYEAHEFAQTHQSISQKLNRLYVLHTLDKASYELIRKVLQMEISGLGSPDKEQDTFMQISILLETVNTLVWNQLRSGAPMQELTPAV